MIPTVLTLFWSREQHGGVRRHPRVIDLVKTACV
jgi:hypothetical protein